MRIRNLNPRRSGLPGVLAWCVLFNFFYAQGAETSDSAITDANVYSNIIAPVLNQHCVSCHGPEKKKGGLALHTKSDILLGGDSGDVLVNGNLNDSQLYQRIILSSEHDDVMPPSSKPRLALDKIELIAWWISLKQPFTTDLQNVEIPENIQTYITLHSNDNPPRREIIQKSIPDDKPTTELLIQKDTAWLLCEKFCFDCHDEESSAKANFSVSKLLQQGYSPEQDNAWNKMIQLVETGYMPPKTSIPVQDQELLVAALEQRLKDDLKSAQVRLSPKLRRLTRLEYNNRIRDLFDYPSDVIPMTERIPITRQHLVPIRGEMASTLEIHQTDPTAKGKVIFQRIGLQAEKTAESGFDNDEDILPLSVEHIQSFLGLANAIVSHESSLSKSKTLRDLLTMGPQVRLGVLMLLVALSVHCLILQKMGLQHQLHWLLVIFFLGIFLCQFAFHGPALDLEIALCIALLIPFAICNHDVKSNDIEKTTPDWKQTSINATSVTIAMCIATNYRGWDFALGMWSLAGILAVWLRCERLPKAFVKLSLPLVIWGIFILSSIANNIHPPSFLSENRLYAIQDRSGFFQSWRMFLWILGFFSLLLLMSVLSLRKFSFYRNILKTFIPFGLIVMALYMPRTNRELLGGFDHNFTPKGIWEKQAHYRIKNLMEQAYAIPSSDIDTSPYIDVYRKAISEGESFSDAMARSVAALLISPQFLFHYDTIPSPQSPAEWKLAHRLSWFLWKGLPDERLKESARNGSLTQLENLKMQVKRMLNHSRVRQFIEDFSIQWLKLAKLDTAKPDPELFPEYYNPEHLGTLATSMKLETILHFEKILFENRSIMEFVESETTYVNMRLAQLYACEDKIPNNIRQKQLWESDQLWHRIDTKTINRGGLPGMAGSLTLTSFSKRTSPVKRGIWTLDVLMNRPPPAPKIAASFKRDEFIENETIRDRLTRHRRDPACATCHKIIDPMGFAVEVFDPIGRFRHTEKGLPIDSSGQLANGKTFDDFESWKSLMMAEKSQFRRGFIEKLMAYALGRSLHAFDRPAITKIVEHMENNGDTIASAIEGIVISPQFLTMSLDTE